MIRWSFLMTALIAAVLVAAPVFAASAPESIGRFGAWGAFSHGDNGAQSCFISAQPQKMDAGGKTVQRGDVFFFVTHWPEDGTRNVVSVSFGYPVKENTNPSVTIDGQSFTLFVQGEMAWAKDQKTDNAIADALRRGSKLVVKGESRRGTKTTDTYSLKGSGDAFKAINKACSF